MKKIVFIHLFNDRSGSPKVLSQVIKSLKKKFHTELLTSDHTDGFLTDTADQQHMLFYRRSENKLLTLLYYLISQVLLFIQCLKYWNKDVIFYINTMMPFGAGLAGKLMGKQVYWHIHETSVKPKILKQFLRFIISLTVNKIIFVSDYLKETEAFTNTHQYTVYNAISSDFLSNSKKTQKSDENFNVLMVCSLKKYKGIFEFIKIANILEKNPKINFILVLNAQSHEINTYLKNEILPSNLQLYSRQLDVSSFYANSDLLLNLSRPDEVQETFGLTILEGMAHGLPVIVPPVGGPAEIVREGVEGFLISCYKIEDIAKKILYLANNTSEYETLSANALKRVGDFSEKEFEKNIYTIFEDKQ